MPPLIQADAPLIIKEPMVLILPVAIKLFVFNKVPIELVVLDIFVLITVLLDIFVKTAFGKVLVVTVKEFVLINPVFNIFPVVIPVLIMTALLEMFVKTAFGKVLVLAVKFPVLIKPVFKSELVVIPVLIFNELELMFIENALLIVLVVELSAPVLIFEVAKSELVVIELDILAVPVISIEKAGDVLLIPIFPVLEIVNVPYCAHVLILFIFYKKIIRNYYF